MLLEARAAQLCACVRVFSVRSPAEPVSDCPRASTVSGLRCLWQHRPCRRGEAEVVYARAGGEITYEANTIGSVGDGHGIARQRGGQQQQHSALGQPHVVCSAYRVLTNVTGGERKNFVFGGLPQNWSISYSLFYFF